MAEPPPAALKRMESGLWLFGLQMQADDLVAAMNRAGRQAVPEAKMLLVGAIQNMSLQDAKGLLAVSDTAATDYFHSVTCDQLTQKTLNGLFFMIAGKKSFAMVQSVPPLAWCKKIPGRGK